MSNIRRTLLIAVVTFVAAVAGVFAGRAIFGPTAPVENELHLVLHDRLSLDKAQRARIDRLENSFSIRRRALEDELRATNNRLAVAIEKEHVYGPKVASAVDSSHIAMGELQKETLRHVFAMRGVLRPDQAATFDDAVVKALTATGK